MYNIIHKYCLAWAERSIQYLLYLNIAQQINVVIQQNDTYSNLKVFENEIRVAF